MSQVGVLPLSHTEVLARCVLTGTALCEHEVDALMDLDTVQRFPEEKEEKAE